MLIARPAESLDDLRIATDLMSQAWLAGSAFVAGTPAALDWWYVVGHPDALRDHLRLWADGATPVAWSWHEGGEIEWHVWTGDPASDIRVLREILETVIRESAGITVAAFAAEDDLATIGLFGELGFGAEGRRLSQWQRLASDEPLTPAALPDGYRCRSLTGRAEFEARVQAHRSAFPSSRLTVEKYERMLTVPHYRFEDDLVVEAPDGAIAAYAMAWWDPVGRVGEFEPLGTHPDHQRRGLARALLSIGLRRYFDMGARTVQVYSDTSSEPAERLYEAVGFRRRAFHQRYERPAPTAPGVRSTP